MDQIKITLGCSPGLYGRWVNPQTKHLRAAVTVDNPENISLFGEFKSFIPYLLLLYFTANLKKMNDSNLGFHNQLLVSVHNWSLKRL